MFRRKLLQWLMLSLLGGVSAAAWALPARLPVSQEGIHTAAFDALGLSQPVAVEQLRLYNRGFEVAMTVIDANNNGFFETGDHIEFYGQPVGGGDPEFKYTETNIYWLDTDGGTQRAVPWQADPPTGAPEPVYRARKHFEKNWTYWQAMPDGAGKDHWFWGERLTAGDTRAFPVTLSNISSSTSAVIRVALHGATDIATFNPDHRTRIMLNGAFVGDVMWDGATDVVQEFTIASSLLLAGDNTVSFTQGGLPNVTLDSAYVNWIEIEYDRAFVAESDQLAFSFQGDGRVNFAISNFAPGSNIHAYDITDPARVRRVVLQAGADGVASFSDFFLAGETKRYRVAGEAALVPLSDGISFQEQAPTLTAPDKGADYVIITHEDLLGPDIDRLAQHRRNDGYQVEVVTTREIYDSFSAGLFTPVAIKDFLRHAYDNWNPAPQFVVLIGDASLDYKDYYNTEQGLRSQFVPTYAAEAADFGESPSDNWFVTVGGDNLPVMYIGRIPAKNTDDIRLVVDKIIAYETGAAATWQTRFLMTSGDHEPRFAEQSDAWLADYVIPRGYRPLRVDLNDYGAGEKVLAKGDFRGIINGEGVVMASYFGHGNVNGWIASAGFEILNSAEAENTLINDRALPFFVAFNCLNGLFAQPSEGRVFPLPDGSGISQFFDIPLSEALLFHPAGGGAIAMWSPASLAYPSEQKWIGANLFSLIIEQGVTRLGEAATLAKVQAVTEGRANAENLDIFTFIGDPATRLALGAAGKVSGGGGGGSGMLNPFVLLPLLLWGVAVSKRRIHRI